VKELTEDGSATFHFIHGPCKAVPPEGFEEYFGKPPYFRFIEPDRDVEKTHQDDVLARIRDFPDCETPEDTMRELMREGIATTHRSTDNALKYLLKIMQERGPFDAIIGYSEGATVAATLLLHEQRRFRKKGIKPMFKYAIFFAGWPPVDPDTHAMILCDESDATIEIPTCHISEPSPPCRMTNCWYCVLIRWTTSWLTRPLCARVVGALQRLRPRQRLLV
jgi:predicted esterase